MVRGITYEQWNEMFQRAKSAPRFKRNNLCPKCQGKASFEYKRMEPYLGKNKNKDFVEVMDRTCIDCKFWWRERIINEPEGDDLCKQGDHFIQGGRCTACGFEEKKEQKKDKYSFKFF